MGGRGEDLQAIVDNLVVANRRVRALGQMEETAREIEGAGGDSTRSARTGSLTSAELKQEKAELERRRETLIVSLHK